jgi:hypothetical protein
LSSGAWWFYQKLGFRPKDRATRKLMEQELRRMKREPGHRTSIDTLRELARENVYLHLGAERDDVVGLVTFGDVGMAVLDHVARRSGADRDRVADELDREAAALVGGVDFDGWSAEERASWRSWAPLIVTLPGTASWTKEERAALVDVARAKGGRRESDFVRTFDRHAPLRAAILGLIEGVEL